MEFLAPRAGRVRLTVHDIEGRRLTTLLDGELGAGLHELRWDGRSPAGGVLPAGMYLVRLVGFGCDELRRLALTR